MKSREERGEGLWTYTLAAGSNIIISKTQRLTMLTVECVSSTSGTILGELSANGRTTVDSSSISVVQNNPKVIVSRRGRFLDGIKITAPVDCTLEMYGSIEL